MDSLEAAALPQLALMCVGKVGLQLLCAFHVLTFTCIPMQQTSSCC